MSTRHQIVKMTASMMFPIWFSVADPGLPKGNVNLIGGVDSHGGYVSKNVYVETKESGPLGGRAPRTPPDPRMVLCRATSTVQFSPEHT